MVLSHIQQKKKDYKKGGGPWTKFEKEGKQNRWSKIGGVSKVFQITLRGRGIRKFCWVFLF